MVIGFNAVPDAITQVDAPFRRKFTITRTIVTHWKGMSQAAGLLTGFWLLSHSTMHRTGIDSE
jgi:hypothetical protein